MPITHSLLTMLACLALAAGALAPDRVAQAADSDRDRESERERGHDRDRDRQDERGQADRRLSLDEAMAQAEKRYKARAVSGEERRQGDRIVYRIRLLDKDGRVFEVSVDAGSSRDR